MRASGGIMAENDKAQGWHGLGYTSSYSGVER